VGLTLSVISKGQKAKESIRGDKEGKDEVEGLI
jgi:hypothetical protein